MAAWGQKGSKISLKYIYIYFYLIVLQQQNNRLSALSLSYDVSFHITGNQTQVSQSERTVNILLQEWIIFLLIVLVFKASEDIFIN